MTIEYGTPPPPTVTKHDHIYTTLLAVLAFCLLFGITSTYWITRLPTTQPSGNSVLLLVMAEEGFFAVAIAVVVFIRLCFPASRRWPTFALNIILLLFIPLGTALAIYGFWKVDKKLPRGPVA